MRFCKLLSLDDLLKIPIVLVFSFLVGFMANIYFFDVIAKVNATEVYELLFLQHNPTNFVLDIPEGRIGSGIR